MCSIHKVPCSTGKQKFLSKEGREVFARERTLAINLELWVSFGYVKSKVEGKTFKS